jgi:uncharacterized protein YdeI (BOF family)
MLRRDNRGYSGGVLRPNEPRTLRKNTQVTLRGKIVRKVKIMVVAVATTLLVASPAFAADNNSNGGGVFTAKTGFMQDATLRGTGFDLTAGSITNNNGNNGNGFFGNGGDNGDNAGSFFGNDFMNGGIFGD